jgi:hypothetical protein
MKKNLDISEDAVKAIAIEAVKSNSNFKNLAEQILENYAKPFMALQKPKSARAKSKQ